MYQRGDVWKVKLYPTRGAEQDGIRPCLIVSPNSLNSNLENVIVLPMTKSLKPWPTRVELTLNQVAGQACIEHIRSVSKTRLIEKLGTISLDELATISKRLQATFAL
ncbi:MAG: type II toxin-antitoxin system PemK/MazF family toxin [Bdellovibrionales bacterium]|nr:type II toxin-antitoxin system PemK/MazF family toxin [Bdellovibrionales bacterium]